MDAANGETVTNTSKDALQGEAVPIKSAENISEKMDIPPSSTVENKSSPSKINESNEVSQDKTSSKEDEMKINSELEKNNCKEEKDDLLEKIEEVVKDAKTDSTAGLEDVSQTSEGDFFKKIDEIEKGENSGKKKNDNANKCENTEDKVTVGKLVFNLDDGDGDCKENADSSKELPKKDSSPIKDNESELTSAKTSLESHKINDDDLEEGSLNLKLDQSDPELPSNADINTEKENKDLPKNETNETNKTKSSENVVAATCSSTSNELPGPTPTVEEKEPVEEIDLTEDEKLEDNVTKEIVSDEDVVKVHASSSESESTEEILEVRPSRSESTIQGKDNTCTTFNIECGENKELITDEKGKQQEERKEDPKKEVIVEKQVITVMEIESDEAMEIENELKQIEMEIDEISEDVPQVDEEMVEVPPSKSTTIKQNDNSIIEITEISSELKKRENTDETPVIVIDEPSENESTPDVHVKQNEHVIKEGVLKLPTIEEKEESSENVDSVDAKVKNDKESYTDNIMLDKEKENKKEIRTDKDISETKTIANEEEQKTQPIGSPPPSSSIRVENKKIISVIKHVENNSHSLNTTPISTTNVFNSTPIQKQFEISSENVSKISETAEASLHKETEDKFLLTEGNTSSTEKSTLPPSVKSRNSDNTIESGSSEDISKYTSAIKKCNGTTDDESYKSEDKSTVLSDQEKESQQTRISSNKDISQSHNLIESCISPAESVYEVNLWLESNNDIKFLYVEKLDKKKFPSLASSGTVENSSNGSVSSLPQFPLPSTSKHLLQASSSSSDLTSSSTSSNQNESDLKVIKIRHTIKGIPDVCSFLIAQLTKIRSNFVQDCTKAEEESTTKVQELTSGRLSRNQKDTPTKRKATPSASRKSPSTGKNSQLAEGDEIASKTIEIPTTPKVGGKRSRKRSLNKAETASENEDDQDEDGPKPKKSRKSQASKSQSTPSKEIEASLPQHDNNPKIIASNSATGNPSYICVFAKWVDKKYYAGKVDKSQERAGNKFSVLFEDGATKVLPKESIVFGNDYCCPPLKNNYVYALVDDDYERGLVTSIEKVDNKILYTVETDKKTVQVKASELYLQKYQVDAIQSAEIAQSNVSSSIEDGEIKAIQQSAENVGNSPSTKAVLTGSGTAARSTRNKRSVASPATPEAGFSGGMSERKGGKRQKRSDALAKKLSKRISESSDLSDIPEQEDSNTSLSGIDMIEGVQPELQRTSKESEISKMLFNADLIKLDPNYNEQHILGPFATSKTLFRNKHFLLTCTVGLKPDRFAENDKLNIHNKDRQFSNVPFVKSLLQKAIENGGGKVYNYFEDIPKTKYRLCKLIVPRPCLTAKYIQCLAADIPAISHEWIIDCCKANKLLPIGENYHLPSGWSILTEKFIEWSNANHKILKNSKERKEFRESNQPFAKTHIIIASLQQDFIDFWSRVCKLAGGIIRFVKCLDDITPTTKGYLIADSDFPQVVKSKAEHYQIPVVSTVWVVQSLILGKICEPDSHKKLKEIFEDDSI